MKDAFGGLFTIQLIVIFVIIINSYLAFSVNYTKAFRVKNEIRSIIEKQEGLTCDAIEQIDDLFERVKYRPNSGFNSWCSKNGYEVQETDHGSFCWKFQKVDVTGNYENNQIYKGGYYTIATFVNVDIPLVNKIYPFAGNLFLVKGETALIYSSGLGHDGAPRGC